MAVPSCPPDVADFRSPWAPPFLSVITSKQNRLKACVVAGRAACICIFLFDPYQPRSSDLRTIMECAVVVQAVTGTEYETALFRLQFTDSKDTPVDPPADLQALKDVFARYETPQYMVVLDLPISLMELRVWFPEISTAGERFVSLALVEILTLIRMTAGIYGAGKMNDPEIFASWPSLRFTAKGAGFSDVSAIGNAVSRSHSSLRRRSFPTA
jgi:hypothetical protein